MSFTEVVTQGCSTWNIHIDQATAARLEEFSRLLLAKNQVMNLTAITEPEQVALRHIVDCLYQLRCVDFAGKRVVDVGSGGGFPGVPLQIAQPDARFLLLDSRKKRVDFLQEVCGAMDLPARTMAGRAEEAARQKDLREAFDIAVSRAVAPLNVLCELCLPFVKKGGFFLAMKSDNEAAAAEVEQAQSAIGKLGGLLRRRDVYTLSGTDVAHQVLVIEKVRPTPPAYPRRYAKIEGEPL